MFASNQFKKSFVHISIGENGPGAMNLSVLEFDANRAIFFDNNALNRCAKKYFAIMFFNDFNESVGQSLRAADGIISSVEIVTEDGSHASNRERFGIVAEITRECSEQILHARVAEEFIEHCNEWLVHPLVGMGMCFWIGQQILAGIGSARRAARLFEVCIHIAKDKLYLVEEPTEIFSLRRETLAQLADKFICIMRDLEMSLANKIFLL